MTTEFDALDHAGKLEAAGVPKEQAMVHAQALSEVLGTVAYSRDLFRVEHNLRLEIQQCEERMIHRIEMFRVEVNARIDALEISLRAEIKNLETSLRAEIKNLETSLRAEIADLRSENRLTRALLGVVVALNIAILVKMLFP